MNYEIIYDRDWFGILEKLGYGRINTIIARFYCMSDADDYLAYLNREDVYCVLSVSQTHIDITTK